MAVEQAPEVCLLLKQIRIESGHSTPKHLAAVLGIDVNKYEEMEAGTRGLNLALAKRIVKATRLTKDRALYFLHIVQKSKGKISIGQWDSAIERTAHRVVKHITESLAASGVELDFEDVRRLRADAADIISEELS